jgi:membrane-associated phospholipid phosphatase
MATRESTGSEIIKDFDVLGRAGEESFSHVSVFDRLRGFLQYLIAAVGVDLVFLFFMTLVLVVSVIMLDGHIRFLQASVGLPLGVMAAIIVIKYFRSRGRASAGIHIVLRDWLPFLLIAFIYENLHDIAGRINSHDIAGLLYRWDGFLFGVQPTIWAQKLYSPWFTDVMSFSYALYFAFPLVLMFFLSLQNRRRAFKHMVLALSFTFIIGFLCYVFFPCSPPRYFMTELYTDPRRLQGIVLYNRLQDMWDGFSVIRGGAFPSLHVGLSAVALIYAYKFRNLTGLNKFLWYLYIPLVISLWFSTVYLRHHWVIDIIAGLFVAVFSYVLAGWLLRYWDHLRLRFSLPAG